MVSPEIKSLRYNPKEGFAENHPLFLRGASPDEIEEIIGLNPQIARTDQQKSILFAKRLLEEGMIGEDLTYWNKLQELYRTNKRELPKDFVARLRLEEFFIARMEAKVGNYSLADRFNVIGKSVDKEWFHGRNPLIPEQIFIRDALDKGKNSRNGNNAVVEAASRKIEKDHGDAYGEELRKLGTLGNEAKN